MHTGCAALVGLLAWRVTGRQLTCGVAAAVIFALHPAHVEPVQWITGRVDVLATLFYLAGFGAFIRYRDSGHPRWVAGFGALYGLAAFSKEFGLTLPLMCMMADAIWRPGGAPRRLGAFCAPYAVAVFIAAGYFVCRRAAFDGAGAGVAMPDFASAAFYEQVAQRQLIYLGALFPPLQPWWFVGAPVLQKHALATVGLTLTGLAAGCALWRWRARSLLTPERRAFVFFAVGWYLLSTLPLVVTYISARHLYLASAGACIALVVLLRGWFRSRAGLVLAFLVTGVVLAPPLAQTSRNWHDAARLSGAIAAELRRLEPELKSGGALFLDVPEMRREVFVWV